MGRSRGLWDHLTPEDQARYLRARQSASQTRWADGTPPVKHGFNEYMAQRCRAENEAACEECRAVLIAVQQRRKAAKLPGSRARLGRGDRLAR